MKAVFNALKLSHKHFEYIDAEEKSEIESLLNSKNAVMVSIKDKGRFQCSAILEVTEFSIHARQIGGQFPKYIQNIEMVCHALARIYKKSHITFCTDRKSVEKIGSKLGFYFDPIHGEFKKEVI